MLSERAVHKLRNRRQPPTCYLFDMELNGRYWHWWDQRTIHNTGLITNWCAPRPWRAVLAGGTCVQDMGPETRQLLQHRAALTQVQCLAWLPGLMHSLVLMNR